MTSSVAPARWANTLTLVLNSVYGADRFPVDVTTLSQEYSRQRFPDEPITLVAGESLPDFDGALYRAPPGKKGWGIIYNNAITSQGRINFTLAHEFGHYLLHRDDFPAGIECSQQDIVRWDNEYQKVERQANEFAATLLMPLDDFRRLIGPHAKPTLDDIGVCAERYGVSLIAATLRWLRYTERRSVIVVSRDGFILWARSSDSALKTGAFFHTANRPPRPIPELSLAARGRRFGNGPATMTHKACVWFAEPCEEMVLSSDRYDFAISVLNLDDTSRGYAFAGEADEEDAFARITRASSRSAKG